MRDGIERKREEKNKKKKKIKNIKKNGKGTASDGANEKITFVRGGIPGTNLILHLYRTVTPICTGHKSGFLGFSSPLII
jgi:tRNA/tmRNA/rRNA uracil-C5-methylase (TrmA/RlmC/RlmD family)